MIRALIITTIVGIVVSVIFLTAATALASRDIAKSGWRWNDWAVTINDDGESEQVHIGPAAPGQGGVYINGKRAEAHDAPPVDWSGPTETREFAWAGGDAIEICASTDATYTQGPTPRVTVTGPKGALDRFNIEDDSFCLRGRSIGGFGRLKIDITAPAVTNFDVSGASSLAIRGYAQDRLSLDVSGAAQAAAQGTARQVMLDLSGASRVDLAGLAHDELAADLSGASWVKAGPRTSADIDASGGANVVLTRRPAQITQSLSGGAHVKQP